MPLPERAVTPQCAGVADNLLDLSLVVPCLNEEARIQGTLDSIASAMRELPHTYEVLVIDDGSTDQTSEKVKAYVAAHPDLPIRLHINARNRGLTRSYVDGAFLSQGKYYRMVCGDNVEPKETLIAVLRHLGEADMIIPYHVEVPGKSAFRKWLSGFYTHLVNGLSGYQIRYYNGLAAHLRYNVMRWGSYSFGFGFQAELITRLLDESATFIEVPVTATHQEKSGGNSALNINNFFSVGHTLLEVCIRRVRKRAFKK
jgi:glycosyltransferase involved in cell wall biosynthesis